MPQRQSHFGLRNRLLPLFVRCRSSQLSVAKRCHYAVLGVPTSASSEEIRAAYYSKCKATHPDLTASDSRAFLEVNEAYNILIDPELRRMYDNERGTVPTQQDMSPHFSCSPYGPKITYDRATEIFRSRKFRRHSTWYDDRIPHYNSDFAHQDPNTYDEYYFHRESSRRRTDPTNYLILSLTLGSLVIFFFFND